MNETKPKRQKKLGVRADTYAKFEAFAGTTRRKLSDSADIAADLLLKYGAEGLNQNKTAPMQTAGA